ncbi:MAG: hypothetical protein D6814_16640 [Calditrichaeota bacterium]|nr:MAG: hypothetical protein D6814_16640 [Calditrichota bacterium]
MQNHKYAKAEPYLLRLAKAPGATAKTLEALVNLYFAQQNYRKALPWLEKLRKMDPQNPAYLENLAIAYDWLGEPENRDRVLKELAQKEE